MDSPPSTIWTWPQALALATIASFSAIAGYFLRRKKLPSEIHKTEADAAYIEAQTEELELRTSMTASDFVKGTTKYIVDLERQKADLQEQVRVLESQVEQFKADRMLKQLKG